MNVVLNVERRPNYARVRFLLQNFHPRVHLFFVRCLNVKRFPNAWGIQLERVVSLKFGVNFDFAVFEGDLA